MQHRSKWARVLVPMLGGSMLLGSMTFAVDTALFIRNAKSVTGAIDSTAEMRSYDGDTLYQATFSFIVSEGTYAVTPQSLVSTSPGTIGERIQVLYDVRDPQCARIESFVYTWAIPVVLLLLAVVFDVIYFAIC